MSFALINFKPHPGEYEYCPVELAGFCFGTAVILESVALIVWLHDLQILLVQLQYETLPVLTELLDNAHIVGSA